MSQISTGYVDCCHCQPPVRDILADTLDAWLNRLDVQIFTSTHNYDQAKLLEEARQRAYDMSRGGLPHVEPLLALKAGMR